MTTTSVSKIGHHGLRDHDAVSRFGYWNFRDTSAFTYTFENFFHPFVGELIQELNQRSLAGLFDAKVHEGLVSDFFSSFYKSGLNTRVSVKAEPKEIDVRASGTYANYNWELLFHVPLAVAVHLSKNQRFAESQRWFHYIFDPTNNEDPPQYWRFIGFRHGGAGKEVDELLRILSTPDSELTAPELVLKAEILDGYRAIVDHPFEPHRVARAPGRRLAYMYSVVMKYLDNLIAWGDHLFRQDTLESINEATQIYVLAANILGERPQKIPLKGTVRPQTFAQLKARGLDPLGNAMVELEGLFPFNFGIPKGQDSPDSSAPLLGIGRTLYFCVPRNEKLLAYWDTVGDRLFKIRHCLNLAGVFRPLALFDPPLDPGMLVKAAASGIDIGAVAAGLNQPASPVRAQFLIQKAIELCGEVRNLGAALLAAIEKGDGERLSLLRQGHEVKILGMQKETLFLKWKQSQEGTESLLKSRSIVLERYQYYMRLLGREINEELTPGALVLDRRELTEENFDEAFTALVEQYATEVPTEDFARLERVGADAPSANAGSSGPGRLSLTKSEGDEIGHLESARNLALTASIVDATGSAIAFIPDPKMNFHFWGVGGTVGLKVGTAILKGIEIASKIIQMQGAWEREQAGIGSRTGGHERRADDWTFQANVAARELRQLGRQVISSLIGEQIARREYQVSQEQIENAEETDRFLREKFSNAELYGWMQGELSRLYYECYRFAFDAARRAEFTAKKELMRAELDSQTFVKFNYWDGGRKGLLSGEGLCLDLKRLEGAYHEYNLREYELTKHVSTLQVDPFALIQLRSTGRCTLRLPETFFDLDGPGHYFRRLMSVAISVPCVTGPYASINCKLTLLKSSVRKSAQANNGYEREGLEDDRFQDYFGSVQSIVASSGQQDSGLFETSVRDERYLPFEKSGAISEWQLELPADPSQGDPSVFDYNTIADVILHLRFTARDGGSAMKSAALQNVKDLIDGSLAAGWTRLLSMRHEFASQWAAFKGQTPGANQRYRLAFELRPEHYPYWSQNRAASVPRVDLLARIDQSSAPPTLTVSDRADKTDSGANKDLLTKSREMGGLLVGQLKNIPSPQSGVGPVEIYLDTADMSDFWIAITWAGG